MDLLSLDKIYSEPLTDLFACSHQPKLTNQHLYIYILQIHVHL